MQLVETAEMRVVIPQLQKLFARPFISNFCFSLINLQPISGSFKPTVCLLWCRSVDKLLNLFHFPLMFTFPQTPFPPVWRPVQSLCLIFVPNLEPFLCVSTSEQLAAGQESRFQTGTKTLLVLNQEPLHIKVWGRATPTGGSSQTFEERNRAYVGNILHPLTVVQEKGFYINSMQNIALWASYRQYCRIAAINNFVGILGHFLGERQISTLISHITFDMSNVLCKKHLHRSKLVPFIDIKPISKWDFPSAAHFRSCPA